MLSSTFDSGPSDDSDANNGELLREIEEISKALYLDRKTHQSSLISSSDLVPRSIKKSHFADLKSNSKLGFSGDDEWLWQEKKPSSIWGWKPFKALSHIRQRKFTCCFFCHVHCIENLPLDFDGISVSVHCQRKDNVLTTLPSRVSNGVVEFEETLMSKCGIHAVKNGSRNFVKYEPKHFLLYASIVGAGGLAIGKHWVDLTRLLPVTIEELEEEKCSGRWSTSLKLAGKAKGATLHVSFAFLVIKDGLAELGSNMKLPLVLNLEQNGLKRLGFVPDFEPDRGEAMLRRVGSVPSSLTNTSSNACQSLDVKFDLPNDVSDFSDSVNMLYGMLEEGSTGGPAKLDLVLEELESLNLVPTSFSSSGEDFGRGKYEEAEPIVIDKGIELEQNADKEIILDESAAADLDVSVVEMIDVAEIFKAEGISSDEDTKSNIKDEAFDCVVNDIAMVEDSVVQVKDSSADTDILHLHKTFISEIAELESSLNDISDENEVNCKGRKLVKSLSLDDVTKAVADNLFNLLQEARSPSALSSNGDLESPRERLLREFEEDMMTSGSFFLGVEEQEDEESDYAATSVYSSGFNFEGIDLSPVIDTAGHNSVHQSSKSKMKAAALEQLETESLMHRWGLNEELFQSSPHYSTGGFGSPIYVPPKEPIRLPPLEEGLGPLLHLKDGGLLQSMSPLLFKNVKKCGSLVMQTSMPVVLPAELGSDIMDILQRLASIGITRLSKQLHKLMPLEELSGRIIQQLSWEASCEAEPPNRSVSSQSESDIKIEVGEALHVLGVDSDCVSVKDLAFLALNKVEVLTIEGLRIQSGMPDQVAPSIIKVKSASEITTQNRIAYDNDPSNLLGDGDTADYVEGLLDLSISLNDWLSLDAGRFDDKNRDSGCTKKLLAAHHAKSSYLNNRNSRGENSETDKLKFGLLGDSLTAASMIQLRDPLRNYEPVGAPMIGLIQVERVHRPGGESNYSKSVQESSSELEEGREEQIEDDKYGHDKLSMFRANEVHVAGLNIGYGDSEIWASRRQQQSGSRWLLASGLSKNRNCHIAESRFITRRPTQLPMNPWTRNVMWSLSHHCHGAEADPLQSSIWDLLTRNPDVMFPKETR